MRVKTISNYSPNFNLTKRRFNELKFLIFHYTGMRSETEAIKRLTDFRSKVSSHYLIKNNGDIVLLVPDLYVAWHAGKSSWKNFKLLNDNSIGIEISNPGHEYNYKKYSTKQITSLIKLSKKLIKTYKIKKYNVLGHSDIAPDRKMDPGEKFPWQQLATKGIGIWHTLSDKKLKDIRKLNIELGQTEEKKFYKNLIKIGYSKLYCKNSKLKSSVIKAFQRHFRQQLVNGKLDKECLIISENIVKKFV